MQILEDVVLEFAEWAVKKLGGDGFGAEEHAIDSLLGEAGACKVFAHEVVKGVKVGAVVGLGEVHQFLDFEGTVHVVDAV